MRVAFCIVSLGVSLLRCLFIVRAMREPASRISEQVQNLTSFLLPTNELLTPNPEVPSGKQNNTAMKKNFILLSL